ncbi:hypothetical protein HPP92_005316 [Vanilla planifolia]|uniref:Uncharacterized protein n=1 Tax=Vanilla planifolia TaxID=51239 RepID=A0A835RYD4_VANPL|nr:hypothetical protein HPP92_005316 [Vanilla planifolia]
MSARGGERMLARAWAWWKPHCLLSPPTANGRAFFTRPALASAHFCTDGAVSQSSQFKVFDRDLKRKQVSFLYASSSRFLFHGSDFLEILFLGLQRDRAAWLMGGKNDFVDSVAENILDRLESS